MGQQVVDGITSQGGAASYFCTDVSKSDQVEALVAHAVETYGRTDVLMNNAYSGRSASVLDMTEAEWDAMLQDDAAKCVEERVLELGYA